MSAIGPELLTRLLEENGRALELFARQHCQAAADAVQEALIELAAQQIAPAQPLAWLYRVVRNRAISFGRQERRRSRHESAAAKTAQAWFVPAPASRLDWELAEAALAALPLEEREVVVAHLWGKQTFEAIGQWMGSSTATAYRRYQAGIESLRMKMGEACSIEKTSGNVR